MKHYVYLAGPITGLSYGAAVDWREGVEARLNSERVECLSPMRGKYHLATSTSLNALGDSTNAMSTPKGITRRDRFDCTRSSVVLVNFLGATRPSLGTTMEVAWCYDRGIPCAVVMEKDNVHQHAMIVEGATYVVDNLPEAERLVRFILNEPPEEA